MRQFDPTRSKQKHAFILWFTRIAPALFFRVKARFLGRRQSKLKKINNLTLWQRISVAGATAPLPVALHTRYTSFSVLVSKTKTTLAPWSTRNFHETYFTALCTSQKFQPNSIFQRVFHRYLGQQKYTPQQITSTQPTQSFLWNLLTAANKHFLHRAADVQETLWMSKFPIIHF